jgi:hypothetical protein
MELDVLYALRGSAWLSRDPSWIWAWSAMAPTADALCSWMQLVP